MTWFDESLSVRFQIQIQIHRFGPSLSLSLVLSRGWVELVGVGLDVSGGWLQLPNTSPAQPSPSPLSLSSCWASGRVVVVVASPPRPPPLALARHLSLKLG